MNSNVRPRSKLLLPYILGGLVYLFSVCAAYYLGLVKKGFSLRDLKIEPKVTVLPSEPGSTYLIEPVVELNGARRVRHGRAIYVDSSGKTIAWLVYENDEIIDKSPKGIVFDAPQKSK